MSLPRTLRRLGAAAVTAVLAVGLATAATPSASARPPGSSGLSGPQRAQLLAMLPYVDRNPSRSFEDRKLSITVFTACALFFALTVLMGSFFRGGGWQWLWPWQGISFDL